MTIKEIEQRSGMTRANIRFYESQCLISPVRGENGYRDYSEDDLHELERIRLLRSLDLPLEDVRRIKNGQQDLAQTLDAHISCLSAEQMRLGNVQEVCLRLYRDNVSYAELDAAVYLDALSGTASLEDDAMPKVSAPWRRYFARALDTAIYSLIFDLFLFAFFAIDIQDLSIGWTILSVVVSIGLAVALEPVMLHFWGATPGKFILGLRVTSPDGSLLKYTKALERTCNVLAFGEALYIPGLSLYCNFKSFRRCETGDDQPWEEDSVLTLLDTRRRRALCYICALTVIIFINASLAALQPLPRNTGSLTVDEFSENFNRVAEYHNYAPDFRLDENGDWIDYPGTVITIMGHDYGDPEYKYTITDGKLTGISFDVKLIGSNLWPPNFTDHRGLMIVAFVRAQNGLISFSDETDLVLDRLMERPFDSWQVEANGVLVTSEVEYSGYDNPSVGALYPREGETQIYKLSFSMELIK